jgi:hypothetical protein
MTPTPETPTGDRSDCDVWDDRDAADWCDINGGGIVTPDQIEEMERRHAERAKSKCPVIRDGEEKA